MNALAQSLAPYVEFSRVGFVNILAFRLRYYTGILTYLINVTVYYFIWSAVYGPAGAGHGRIDVPPGNAHRADGHRHRADFSGASASVVHEWDAVRARGDRELLLDGRD